MRQGIAIAEAGGDSAALCTLYDNFGVLHELADRPDSAAAYYRRALDFKLALDDSLGIPFSLNNLAGIAAQQGRLDEAGDLLRRSDDFRTATADSFGLLDNLVRWAELAHTAGDNATAARKYEQALESPILFEQGTLVSYCYERLAALYEEMQDFQRAYRNHRAMTAFRDSLFNVETDARMAALELEFETERKDRQLAESRLAVAARSRQVAYLFAAVGILLVAGIGITRHQHLKRRQLQNEMEWSSRLRRAEYEQRLADEKLRISRELHDNIGAQLTFITSSIDNLAHRVQGDALGPELEHISGFGRDTLGELRQTVWAMKNETGGFDALAAKLQELKRLAAASGQRIEVAVERGPDTAVDLSSGRLLNVYRIAQEAVQNAMKHSGAGQVQVRLRADDTGLLLEVQDRGPGFAAADIAHVGGLDNMRARCAESGGEFELASGDNGTRITCRFPAE